MRRYEFVDLVFVGVIGLIFGIIATAFVMHPNHGLKPDYTIKQDVKLLTETEITSLKVNYGSEILRRHLEEEFDFTEYTNLEKENPFEKQTILYKLETKYNDIVITDTGSFKEIDSLKCLRYDEAKTVIDNLNKLNSNTCK